jgi:hypothetical protein
MCVYRWRPKTLARRQDDITRRRRCIMTTKRQRKKIARELPPVGTTLTARHKGEPHTAVVVEAKDRPAGRAVQYGDQLFASLSAAAKAVTGHSANGWLFWRPAEGSEQ